MNDWMLDDTKELLFVSWNDVHVYREKHSKVRVK